MPPGIETDRERLSAPSGASKDVALSKDSAPSNDEGPSKDVVALYHEYADFVWRCLQRFGVSETDQPDVLQEVFLVVHQKLSTFEGRSRWSTWLYGISLRVASRQRRRVRHRRECPIEADDVLSDGPSPERSTERSQAIEALSHILDSMPPSKRAVFVMFELEGLTCDEIATLLGVRVGTVYSRLHYARQLFLAELERLQQGPMLADIGIEVSR